MTTTTPDANDADDMNSFVSELAADFKANVKVRDRQYHLQKYKNVFLGREAVDYLQSRTTDRADAVALGQLLQDYFVLEHVTRDHPFGDNDYFYHLIERGNRTVDANGHVQGWGVFGEQPRSQQPHGQPSFPVNDIPPQDQHVLQQVWPLDRHNQTLLDHVHPPHWQNPTAATTYDLVVIGGGAAGLVTAAGAAGVGAKVALIEGHLLGGDCLNVGCVPSKTLLHAAHTAHTLRQPHAGISVEGTVEIDFPAVMERVRQVRAQISHHDSAERYSQELGVDVYIGWAKFASASSVVVNGTTLKFRKAAIATGGRPVLLDIPGLDALLSQNDDGPKVMTNETIFNLTERPHKMVVIGPGVIGMELAQAFQRLGTQVTVLGRSGTVLPKENADMAQVVQEQMIRDGVEFMLAVGQYESIELTGNVLDTGYPEMKIKIVHNGEPFELVCDALLMAAGRAPNVDGMNLEAAKVQYDSKRGLVVNDYLQTTNKRIYGVGDVCSQYKFTHAADFMARAVVRNALFFGKEKMSNLLISYATFTSPEIASVGLYEKDLEAKGIAYRTFEKHFKDNDRAIADDATEGFVRFRVDGKTDKILGATIVGAGAGNLISEITLAMQSETGLGSLANVIHPYPTTAEAIRQAGDLYNRTKLTGTVKRVLRGTIRLQR